MKRNTIFGNFIFIKNNISLIISVFIIIYCKFLKKQPKSFCHLKKFIYLCGETNDFWFCYLKNCVYGNK